MNVILHKVRLIARALIIILITCIIVQTTFFTVHLLAPFIPGVTSQAALLFCATADVAYGVITANILKENVVNQLIPNIWR